jgi:4-carboxymuconolactone decarboxylase
MGRLSDIDRAKLSSKQQQVYDHIMGTRGHVRGPFGVWLRNAELCENTLKLQEMFASRVTLERRLLELMILVSARLATAQYAWFIHEPYAVQFGISPGVIQAIRERRTPEFSCEDERLVYDITMELNTSGSLSEANYQRGMALLGEQALVELVRGLPAGTKGPSARARGSRPAGRGSVRYLGSALITDEETEEICDGTAEDILEQLEEAEQ